jgi:hypothetical protein
MNSRHGRTLDFVFASLDVAAMSLSVYFTGGMTSPLYFVYFIPLVIHAFHRDSRLVVFSGFGGVVFYAFAVSQPMGDMSSAMVANIAARLFFMLLTVSIACLALTSDIAQHFPGIVGRDVVLSPAHPRSDVCDEAVAQNPHEKTASFLPLHVQCMCAWREVLMSRADFTRQAAAWSRGESAFLDGYASWLGVRSLAPLPDTFTMAEGFELATMMDKWLSGDVDAMATVIGLKC